MKKYIIVFLIIFILGCSENDTPSDPIINEKVEIEIKEPEKCLEYWDCTEYQPITCPISELQKRSCVCNCPNEDCINDKREERPCKYEGTCDDGILNQNEEAIDCGGKCTPCPSCRDNKKNQDEDGIDCGGICIPCFVEPEIKEIFLSVAKSQDYQRIIRGTIVDINDEPVKFYDVSFKTDRGSLTDQIKTSSAKGHFDTYIDFTDDDEGQVEVCAYVEEIEKCINFYFNEI